MAECPCIAYEWCGIEDSQCCECGHSIEEHPLWTGNLRGECEGEVEDEP